MALHPRTSTLPTALKPRVPTTSNITSPRPTWNWSTVVSAPHRLAFLAGAFTLGLSALWWSVLLVLREQGLNTPWAVAPPIAHALVMVLGFFPFFFVGFLFTAGPKWLQVSPPPTRQLVPFIALQMGAWLLCIVGLHLSTSLAAISMLLISLSWAGLTAFFIQLWHCSQAPDKVHSTLIAAACVGGCLGMGVLTVGLYSNDAMLLRSTTHALLWWFIGLVFVTVSHRMIPFFSASAIATLDAWRPRWLLWMLVMVMVVEGFMAVLDMTLWPMPAAWHWVQASIEIPTAGFLLWLALRWGLLQSLRIRLLAMLHGGFVWLGVAVALQGISHAMQALSGDTQSLGLAPLHALTMGFMGSTLLAMVTRVICGHGGRPLVADNLTWGLYLVLQLAVVARLSSSLWPEFGNWPLLIAGGLWALVWCGWSLRYGNWLGQTLAKHSGPTSSN